MALANITSVYRARLITSIYNKWIKGGEYVLDVGCGTGIVGYELQKNIKIKVHGCDIDKYLIVPIPFTKMNQVDKLPFENNTFNMVMFSDVLHHVEYENQEKLIMESLRVAKVVLLFELRPTPIGKLFDYLINKIHNPRMSIPFTYRTESEWKILFKKMRLKWEIEDVPTPRWYPFSHVAFKLTKKLVKF
ncbi:hypothetical protein A2715_04915 [Candidatus Woesebacteria bacterium RIFCSPHIGHO2_01_FULL_39_32]|uniref:Methyltransferase type 11 domain-containing protein n=1 Tax=Candidatus Woesebacteria bacterium RIFCSPLOWO2_01_FULL_39_25 TaxID=1802521 RepID=A0A1F8BLC8_9BACT|nr:MAG: hypothetical protein A2124_00800 [Candidatus Woesebacteria bacterium GWB1_37_5]OGM25360.1 MAG: hypothetical protein A2715_04915 [Candidatus Woesebacteria bacterium RIFCSPHIGHO2_01_FULL_39_32]OGM37859.1 MAG: hypothetical protein A3F01_02125 [Candidatus Woesebacteria bacterium RIFCSPHIGHO2_12_FULL_38_11]OGM64891.1 MAG: hypothetical protein A2893_04525 [Candidatus Woesebacteria bacterium RIFCSPLOWO2_01_FULL_39_25]